MRPQLSGIFAMVLASTQIQAAPHHASPENATLAKRSWIDDCGDSTFYKDTWCGSPLISDCLVLVSNIAGGGTWEVEAVTGVSHQLAQFGTCAFGVHGDKSINGFYVGNSDISDLIHSSISMFGWKGHVAAHGDMNCQSLEGYVGEADASWGIYRNPGT